MAKSYEERRDDVRDLRDEQRRTSRTLRKARPPKNLSRWKACRYDLRKFIETYHAAACCWPMGEPHLEEISKIQESVLHGGLFAIAMPRGNGKTTLAICAVEWILCYGHLPYVVLVAATQEAAQENLLAAIKADMMHNALLAEDFDAVTYPFRELENEPRRCGGQRNHLGEKTGIRWEADRIVTARVDRPATDEIVIKAVGLTGSFLGLRYARADGSVIRPAFALIDDPQTVESSQSPTQTAKRLKVINNTVLGLAGPGQNMAAVVACTKMRADCLSSQLLDRDKSPRWRGRTFKLVETMPDRMDLWTQYAEVRAERLRTDGQRDVEDAFYRENREAMDAGAVLSWEHRQNPGDLSAIQTAMTYWADDPDFFASEMQNEPLADRLESGALTTEGLLRQVDSYACGTAPIEADGAVAAIDCHGDLLYWLVLWYHRETFTCGIADYGTWPAQRSRTFERARLADTTATEAAKVGIAGEEGVLRHALTNLLPILRGGQVHRADGSTLPIGRIAVDAGWKRDTVYQSILAAGGKEAVALFGRGIRAAHRPLIDPATKKKRGTTRGFHWLAKRGKGEPQHLVFDANFWKSFASSRFRTPLGADSNASMYAGSHTHHKLLIDHLTAEYPTTVSTEERTIEEWSLLPGRSDNHWLDTFVNALVVASFQGANLPGQRTQRQRKRPAQQPPPIQTTQAAPPTDFGRLTR